MTALDFRWTILCVIAWYFLRNSLSLWVDSRESERCNGTILDSSAKRRSERFYHPTVFVRKVFSKRKGWRHTIWNWPKMSPKIFWILKKWKQTIFKHYASRMSDWKIVNSCKVKVKVIFQTFPKYFSWYVFSLIWIEAFLFPTQQHGTYAEGGKNMSSCFICQCLLGSILSS